MSLDTKYRPRSYDDVVGQQGTIRILREIVRSGVGFHQSYLFAGSHGSGKTTLGRILARSLLCDQPVDGQFCGTCPSCLSFAQGSNDNFIEVDAATNSGKADMKKIVDQLDFSTFSGKRRIYLFDEAHQLSRDALDAILKPMEDTLPNSEDKRLICIFCTTEPEKMRQTILSRCAPSFVIQKAPTPEIVERLKFVCEQEQVEYDADALGLIVEITRSHIRDALKSIEGVSMLGRIDRPNVEAYLHLDTTSTYLNLVSAIGKDINAVLSASETLVEVSAPSVIYEKLIEVAMLAYRVKLGLTSVPSYWDLEELKELGEFHQDFLVQMSERLASRPGKPTPAMLQCDLSALHHYRTGGFRTAIPANSGTLPISTPTVESTQIPTTPSPATPVSTPPSNNSQKDSPKLNGNGKVGGAEIVDNVYCPPSARRASRTEEDRPDKATSSTLEPDLFFRLVIEKAHSTRSGFGPKGSDNMGSR